MHILILGAGAMGSLLGARLTRTQALVTLLTTNAEHVHAMRQNGLVVMELDGRECHYSVRACADPRAIDAKVDLVVVLVKSYDTRTAVSSIKGCCHGATMFLTLQNGIGNWEQIAELVGQETVLLGTTAQGSTLLEPGKIRHGGNGPTYIGERFGPASQRVASIVDLFSEAGMESYASDQMERLVWRKLMINVGINAITGLARLPNGVISRLDKARELCAAAVREAMAVAAAKGVSLEGDVVQDVFRVAQATAANRSSMRQDVERGQQTEIDAINGAIVRFGEETSVPTPINWTLTQLIKIVEATYAERLCS